MVSRRDFLKLSGAGVLSLFAANRGRAVLKAQAAIPGGTLDPLAVPKFATPLLIPPVMPKAAVIKQGGKNIDYYEISMKQITEQILPAGLPPTTVWGYGAVKSASRRGLLLHNAPSLTIEATAGRPVRVKWINDLKDGAGNYLPHLLPVDQTLHWANPVGGTAGRDTRPVFDSTPGPYTGPVPIVTHVHGAVGVGDESDGYAEAWYLPAAANIPPEYATVGTWYDTFAAKAAGKFATAWGPGFATFQYPNANRASTIWYHDHALGMTRLNVYAGPAGFYIIRGGPDGDAAVLDTRTNTTAVLPGPAPREGDPFPPVTPYYEFPVAIQDRAFNADGSLFYPNTREFFDGATAALPGYIPATDLSPIWNPEFFGNMVMVNGNTWPFQNVEQRRYRIRFLNGCQSRFLILDFSNIPGVEVWQIGNEGGFLAAPVNVTANHGNKLLLGLAERADMIVDFTNVPLGSYVLGNLGPDEPFGGGEPGLDFDLADPDSTGQIMQFRVIPAVSADPSTPPMFLQLPPIAPLPTATQTRPLALMEEMSQYWDGPAAAMLGTVDNMGMAMHQMWMDPVTEKPNVGDTEVWEFYNYTADAHPMHVHEVIFKVLDRQPITFMESMGHVMDTQLAGPARPPEEWESGFKDTVTAYPGEVTRIQAQFVTPGQFVWHCHIVEHEDN
ncbi:MAG: multicopper oxidase domain-containing protein, partial [Anaerolineales bacterium]|nr:multicopper oxidase domain-containing protein [Anaerolineales bacterium]